MILQAFYNASIYGYVLIIKLVSPFNKKAKQWLEGRKNIFQELSNLESQISNQKIAWFHCASLGEFEQGRPVMEAFKKNYPDFKILLTFFSPSGFEVRKNYVGADYIFYLPADTPQNAQKFIEITKPTIAFFVKYEFWRNYLTELQKQQIPVISFSTIFRENHLFFKSYGGFYREVLFKFNHILVQNQASLNLLKSIDYQQVTLAGDTRFDRVKQISEAKSGTPPEVIPIIEKFKDNKQIFIIGSAWQEDMEVLIPFINDPTPALPEREGVTRISSLPFGEGWGGVKFIIAPHEIHEAEIETWQRQIQLKSIRFSETKETTQLADYQVLIIDNIGMLSSLYQYADFAYIGGAFGKGLHNILEAATFGMPLFFGNKNYKKFQEATDLIQLGGAFSINNTNDISLIINELIINEIKRKQVGNISRNYVLDNIGATEKVLKVVRNLIKNN